MATTTMHFGPEWMRAKPQTRPQPPPSPPPPAASTMQQPGVSTYSALVTPAIQELEKYDESRPFRYTKEEMLRIYKEGGGRGGLNLEVERWEGIVRDVGSDPAGLREMSEAEKKLFAGPLNSELRRRQSTDLINTLSSPSDRHRLNQPNSAAGSPMRDRFGPFLGRRRDSTDQPPLTLPRRLSLSNTQGGTSALPREALPSPRNRMGTFGSGFDGVLNSGDSWSKRRPSVGVPAAGGGTLARVDGKEGEPRGPDIKEEEEGPSPNTTNARDSRRPTAVTEHSSRGPDAPPPDATADHHPPGSDSVTQSIAHMFLEEHNSSNPQITSTMSPPASGPPPGLVDPASIEWSYLDPQGQVQGPFRADLMQKWFDDGYFTADLLMKRTHIDTDWIAVGALERRAGGGKIFLSQLPISTGPPGLSIPAESPQSHSPVHEQSTFNGYQPVPTRTLRTATLDSYLRGASPSESPSSSLSGGRFGNGSPDPSAFSGRAGSSDPSFGGRGFGGRASFQEDPRSFNSIAPGRPPSIDTFNNHSGGGSPWSAGLGQMNQGFDGNEHHHFNGFNGVVPGMIGASVPVNQVHGLNQEHFRDTTYSGMGSLTNQHDSPISRQPSDANGASNLNSLGSSQFGTLSQAHFSQSSVPYPPPQQRQSVSPLREVLPQTSESPNLAQTPASAVQPNSALPWGTRTRPFDGSAATSPVVAPARPQPPEWITPQSPPPDDISPWLAASLPTVDDVWKEMPGPNSLTFSNLGQHNRLQQEEEETAGLTISPIEEDAPLLTAVRQTPTEPTPAVSTTTTVTALQLVTSVPATITTTNIPAPVEPKARRKSTARDVQVAVTKAAPPPPPPAVIKSPSPVPVAVVAAPKPAWGTEEDSKKQKGTGTTTSLRDIQEAEAKKAEARKATEKERERLARTHATATSPSIAEEAQPFTASWGLPTSQAGARNVMSPKEASSTSPPSATPNTPVWTNAVPTPAAKKTMKEIQEEEERRKKLAMKESMASAARRAYAETTVKVVPSVQATGGAWTTVGANGKLNSPAVAPLRQAITPSNNSVAPAAAPRPNGTAARPAPTTAAKVVVSRVEDFPVPPSHDFLKWLGESLKGLNSSVNLEEITSMLLSFPLDPDPSTVEIISDLIYANSTTLDGRRFASEYVSKRKVDTATARRGTAGTSGAGGKPVSIADVVKTQPKPVQQEWGFKVVNKKKKGGRT
ncbi:hypothetical protein PAXRUDRAFT_138292 [Paxillus rubicundulus Ve08.2h10]|uniref:GYF domain-containing protein n=1 Tax=Paxillus rubicundulus Ve08.2h10 TaxID=930991 RepID=A0A0D0E5A9_9AGAM|nr:hypothetical protein PAXRUDRAFT_138292 [Paxillus rubicundulus Ve08.2h10]